MPLPSVDMLDKASESSKSPTTQKAPPTSAHRSISSPRPAPNFSSAPTEPARRTLTFGPRNSSISRAKAEERELLQQTSTFGESSAASPVVFAEPISTNTTAATTLPSLTVQDIQSFTSVAEAKAVIADFSEGQKDDLIEKLLQITLEPFRPAPTLASTIAAIQSSQAPNPGTTALESSSLYALALDSSVHQASESHSSALQSTTLHSSALDSSAQQSALHLSGQLSLAPHTSAFDSFALTSSSLKPLAIHPSAFEPSALDSPTSIGSSVLQPSVLQYSHLQSSDHHSSAPQSSAFPSSALDSSTLKPFVSHSSALEPPALYLPDFDLSALQPSTLQSSGLRSSSHQSSSQSSALQVSTQGSSEHNPSMSTPRERLAREARDEELRYGMPMVQQSSRRLQSALEIFDADPWPTPVVPPQVHKDLVKSNTHHLRHSLRNCEIFAVDMARKTENLEFLDHRVLEFYDEIEIMAAKEEPSVAEPENDFSARYFEDQPYAGLDMDSVDATMTDTEEEITPKIGGGIEEAASGEGEATPKALRTESKGSSRVVSAQSAIPDPLSMPGTFTNAICHQRELLSVPILALTMMDITPTIRAPTAPRCVLLSHLEVGLDGVEALCQGYVTIDESTYWRENVREPRIGRLGIVKAGTGGYSEALKQEQLKKGMGRGEWFWLGIKFQQSGKERKKGKGGKWACFGVPMEAMKRGVIEEGIATYGGGVDGDGKEVPPYEVKVKRMTYRLSIGGIGCMDLWEGAEQWQNGAWEDVKKAMAHNGLLIRIVVPDDKTMELAQTKARAE